MPPTATPETAQCHACQRVARNHCGDDYPKCPWWRCTNPACAKIWRKFPGRIAQ